MSLLEQIINEVLEGKKDYIVLNDMSLMEMAKINTKEFYGFFPYNKFDIRIWSNDHNPPHFHVISNGWNIVVDIMSGNILKVETKNTKDSQMYSYIEKHIKEWLNMPCAKNKSISNRENALDVWEENHIDTNI